jgi:hypothetical protein
MRTVNLKSDMPTVHEALSRLENELAYARPGGESMLKLIHGYGSTGEGGEIRLAVQRRLVELAGDGKIRACIFGEDWSKSNDRAWQLLKTQPDLKRDPHLGRNNRGITIVLL